MKGSSGVLVSTRRVKRSLRDSVLLMIHKIYKITASPEVFRTSRKMEEELRNMGPTVTGTAEDTDLSELTREVNPELN